jgi:hypothetical protein
MYQLLKSLTVRDCLTRQIPTIVASLVIAELFYKFHSFTLECWAFLATWFVLDAAVQGAVALTRWRRPLDPASTDYIESARP